MMKNILLISLFILMQSCINTVPRYDSNVPETPIRELHLNADYYHGKTVKVKGFMVVEHERCVLWSSEDAFNKGDDLNEVIWLIYRDGTCYSIDKLKTKSVRIPATLIGIYNKKFHGHLGVYLGSLQDFYKIE